MPGRQSRRVVVFDLDGTLIDSAPGILASLEAAFKTLGVSPRVRPQRWLIGPPLGQMLTILSGGSDEELLRRLADAFKAHYDESGWRQAEVYPGVKELLGELLRLGIPLYLATNKRAFPTSRILQGLGLDQYFSAVYSPDSVSPVSAGKADLLRCLLQKHRLIRAQTWYVGDRFEDADAALSNEMPFAAAAWGYGGWAGGDAAAPHRLGAPGALIGLLQA